MMCGLGPLQPPSEDSLKSYHHVQLGSGGQQREPRQPFKLTQGLPQGSRSEDEGEEPFLIHMQRQCLVLLMGLSTAQPVYLPDVPCSNALGIPSLWRGSKVKCTFGRVNCLARKGVLRGNILRKML